MQEYMCACLYIFIYISVCKRACMGDINRMAIQKGPSELARLAPTFTKERAFFPSPALWEGLGIPF